MVANRVAVSPTWTDRLAGSVDETRIASAPEVIKQAVALSNRAISLCVVLCGCLVFIGYNSIALQEGCEEKSGCTELQAPVELGANRLEVRSVFLVNIEE